MTYSSRPSTRRVLLRKAAWAVPAVAVAAAAPAVAASGGGTITFYTFETSPAGYNALGRPTRLTSILQFGNTGVPPVTITTITLTVTFPAARVSGAAPTGITGAGWTYGTTSVSGSARSFTFTWTGSLAPYGSSSQLQFDVALGDNSPGTIASTATAKAPGGTTVTASQSDTI